jgi:hypothetical protein
MIVRVPFAILNAGCARLAGLLVVAMAVANSCPAYELTYARTGYQVTAGMDYAIHYELKQLIARHEQLFQRKVPADFKLSYRIFLTREEFEKYQPGGQKIASKSLLGYTRFSSQSRVPHRGPEDIVQARAEIVTWKHEQPNVLLATVLHETTHAVSQAFLLDMPLWMKEGSADWFGRPAWANGRAQQIDRAQAWRSLKALLDEGKLPPVRAYLETEDYGEWDRMFHGHVDVGYVVGYSLFDFFMSQTDAQTYLARLLKTPDVELGDTPGKVFTAELAKTWRGGLPMFERGWHNWIRRKAESEKLPN